MLAKLFGLLKRAFLCRLFRIGESVYLNDNASVEAILYEKKNRYFSFFFYFLKKDCFLALTKRAAFQENIIFSGKRKKKSIFLFVENSFYGRIIVEINAKWLPGLT